MMKVVVTPPRSREQAIVDQFFRDRLQRSVAVEAPPKRSNRLGEVKTAQYFNELSTWLGFTHQVSVRYQATFQ